MIVDREREKSRLGITSGNRHLLPLRIDGHIPPAVPRIGKKPVAKTGGCPFELPCAGRCRQWLSYGYAWTRQKGQRKHHWRQNKLHYSHARSSQKSAESQSVHCFLKK